MGGQTAYHFQPTILKSQPTISKPSLPFEIPAYHSRISPDTSSKTSPTCYNAYGSLNDARNCYKMLLDIASTDFPA